jgi:hypothetical protein
MVSTADDTPHATFANFCAMDVAKMGSISWLLSR